jgi:hypothetical protein
MWNEAARFADFSEKSIKEKRADSFHLLPLTMSF